MILRQEIVSKYLESLRIPFQMTPEGFTLPSRWLLRRGSGIGGQGNQWFLWNLKTGEKTKFAKTKTELLGFLKAKGLLPEAEMTRSASKQQPKPSKTEKSNWAKQVAENPVVPLYDPVVAGHMHKSHTPLAKKDEQDSLPHTDDL